MKFNNIINQIKTANYKEFAIKHVEKFLISFAVLFILYSLSKTSWIVEDRDPDSLVRSAKDAESSFLAQPWAPQEKQKFEVNSNLDHKIQQILYPITVQKYAFSTTMEWPIHNVTEPAVEPNFFEIRHLTANSGRALINLIAPTKLNEIEKTISEIEDASSEELADSSILSQYGITADDLNKEKEEKEEANSSRKSSGRGGRGSRGSQRGNDNDGERSNLFGRDADGGRERRGMRDAVMQQASNSEGVRFISVTGVFPIKLQRLELLKAMNSPDLAATVQMSDLFQDFVIERQVAQPGTNPWAGPWEEVSKSTTEGILQRAAGFDPEVVNQLVTNSTFTMPLPQRARGSWGRYATHPLVENYVLSQDEIKQQTELVENMIEAYLQDQKSQEEAQKEAGGFGKYQFDISSVRRGAQNTTASSGSDKSFLEQMTGLSESERSGKISEKLKELATAESNLLLFRFFDFSVEQGYVYRYRVKLIFNNPNYQRELYRVASPEIADGQYRESDWSKPTLPVAMVDDLQYFVTRVDELTNRPSAKVDAFQWMDKLGTLINESIRVNAGDFVLDKKRTEVINPDEGTFKKEDAEFKSQDMLLSVSNPLDLDEELHSDLEFTPKSARENYGSSLMALFTNQTGALKVNDNLAQSTAQTQMDQTIKVERTAYESLKEGSTTGGSLRGGRGDDDDERGGRRSSFGSLDKRGRERGRDRGRGR